MNSILLQKICFTRFGASHLSSKLAASWGLVSEQAGKIDWSPWISSKRDCTS